MCEADAKVGHLLLRGLRIVKNDLAGEAAELIRAWIARRDGPFVGPLMSGGRFGERDRRRGVCDGGEGEEEGAVRRKEAICIWVSVPEVLIFSGHLWIMARC